MNLEITALTSSGRGVGRYQGQVVFAAGALPGEQVRVRVVGQRRGILEAVTEATITVSPWREESPCPLAGSVCGGCDLAHVRLSYRQHALKECLRPALRGAPEPLKEAVQAAEFYPSPEHYRLRGTLHWSPAHKALGFYAPRSHRVTEPQHCRVLSLPLARLLPGWGVSLARAGFPAGELAFLEDLAGEHRSLLWKGRCQTFPRKFAGVDGFYDLQGTGWGAREVVLKLPLPLAVPVGTFVQGNRFLIFELWKLVEGLVRKAQVRKVLDLYAGVGFFAAAAVAGGAPSVTGVEVVPHAVAAARRNLPQARFFAVSAEKAVKEEILRGQELVIVDPPRGGLSPVVRQALGQSRCPLLLYVSCDPACLARDAQTLLAAGYQVAWAKLFDLFVGTHHGELAVLFRRP